MIRRTATAGLVLLLAGGPARGGIADPGCELFPWPVHAERALFSAPGQPLAAGRDGDAAPLLVPGQLAALHLPAQAEVSFARPPVPHRSPGAAHGGLLRLRVPVDGRYRIALSSTHRVEVLDGQQRLHAIGFNVASDCRAPRKLMRYRLPGGRPLLVQLSGAADAEVRLAITPEPDAPPR